MMNEVICYNKEGLKVIIPNPNLNLKMVADKDVPIGILYKFINSNELPSREFRKFWEIEINKENCNGVGLSKEEFEKTYPEYKGLSVNE